jgi:FkbM family methyltransferase
MGLRRRAVAAVARRLQRPELLAAFYPGARQALREEIAISAILAASLRGDGAYVDVGTNQGQVLREAVRIAPNGRHVAFEPIPSLAAGLARDFPGVETRQLAVGGKPEVAEFCHFKRLEGWSGLRRSPEISDEQGEPEYITVNVSTLDAEVRDLHPNVIKIDVEGNELGVLEGGRGVLSEARPLVIFEHVASAAALYGTRPDAVWELLTELGYEIFAVTGEGPYARQSFVASNGVVNWLARPAA